MLKRIAVGMGVVVAAVALAILVPWSTARAPVCLEDPSTYPTAGIDGWEGEQLENAATIIATGQGLGISREGQILAVMTAMGESSLRNIHHGDWETSGVTNPDGTRTTSIGLFQQQEWWGSVEERMDPASAATLFYGRLARLDGWQQLAPTEAIHRVQINADPDHYARFEADATAIVDAISGICAP